MTNKIIGILTVCVIALAVVAYQLWHEEEPQLSTELPVTETVEEEKPIEPAPQEMDILPTQKNSPQEVAENTESEADDDTDAKPVDEKLCELAHQYDDWYIKNDSYESERLIQDVRDWGASRGYFETEYSKGNVGIKKQSDYDYYEMDDLEEMAKAGDSMANVRLAYRLYLKGDAENMERAQPYCDRAIADGYTALTVCKTSYLVTQIYQERRQEDEEPDQDKLRELELEYQAWRQVSEALGDELGAKLAQGMLGKTEFEFEAEEVEQRSQELANNIWQQRQQLGLGPMNHPPMPPILAYILEKNDSPKEELNACFE